jgi:hypothetical protein
MSASEATAEVNVTSRCPGGDLSHLIFLLKTQELQALRLIMFLHFLIELIVVSARIGSARAGHPDPRTDRFDPSDHVYIAPCGSSRTGIGGRGGGGSTTPGKTEAGFCLGLLNGDTSSSPLVDVATRNESTGARFAGRRIGRTGSRSKKLDKNQPLPNSAN